MRDPYLILPGDGPLAAAAIHSGHDLRDEVRDRLVLPEASRLLEEDPYVELLATGADTVVGVYRSRFEVDLNRPREKAVYRTPEDAWGLRCWAAPPSPALLEGSLAIYDAFYEELETELARLCEQHPRVVMLDLHSYCHRRAGPDAPPADPADNPDVNVGTGSLPQEPWRPVVDRFIRGLRTCEEGGRRLTVEENVRFRGGHLSQWVHQRFPGQVGVLALEFKKFFMDEWTGQLDVPAFRFLREALVVAMKSLRRELERV